MRFLSFKFKCCPSLLRQRVWSFLSLSHTGSHPIDKMHVLLENKIPVILIYGDSDSVVPYEENAAHLEKYYRENGGVIVAIGKENCGHHPHGLDDNTPIIEFVEKYSVSR